MSRKKFTNVEAIRFGWEHTLKHVWFLVGLILFVVFISTGLGRIPGLSFAIGIFASISIIAVALEVYAGRTLSIKHFHSKYHIVLEYLVATVLYGLMVIVGFILLVIPGVYLALKYQFYKFLIVDKEMQPIEALKESARMTKGHMWQLLWLFWLVLVINLLGLLALGVGLFLTVPTTLLAYTFVYKRLSA